MPLLVTKKKTVLTIMLWKKFKSIIMLQSYNEVRCKSKFETTLKPNAHLKESTLYAEKIAYLRLQQGWN